MKKILAATLALSVFATAGVASAQTYGQRGDYGRYDQSRSYDGRAAATTATNSAPRAATTPAAIRPRAAIRPANGAVATVCRAPIAAVAMWSTIAAMA